MAVEKDLGIINVKEFGAKGDGVTDDTLSIERAMAACERKRGIYFPTGEYLITRTIVNKARSISGTGAYVDSGSGGTFLTFKPPASSPDLTPCLLLDQGSGIVVQDISIRSDANYSSRTLDQYIDKTLFEQSKYEMFVKGWAGIEITNSATAFMFRVNTSRIKCGLNINNRVGHIGSEYCNWSGLFGIYFKTNNYDYRFVRGGINGSFCGILIGVKGVAATFDHVHTGFAPYGVYQCIDGSTTGFVGGFTGEAIYLNFEQCGEAAIKLLPESTTNSLRMSGWGFSWSPTDYTDEPGRWQYSLPDALKPRAEKQMYAAYFGKITGRIRIMDDNNALRKSSYNSAALGTTYIDTLDTDADLRGLGELTIRRKVTKYYLDYTNDRFYNERTTKSLSPVSGINLLKDVTKLSNWEVAGNATLSVVTDFSTLPAPLTEELKKYLGSNPFIVKLTPDGVTKPQLTFRFEGQVGTGLVQLDKDRFFSRQTYIYTSIDTAVVARLGAQNWEFIFNDSQNLKGGTWNKIVGNDGKSATGLMASYGIGSFPADSPSYITGVMVSYDTQQSFSPYSHHYVDKSFETKDAFILTDKVTGTRYKITMDNGVLTTTPIT